MNILVSACLLGVHCRYDGNQRINERITELMKRHNIIPFCPEIYGGLATPRDPAEIRNGRVVTKSGTDVTAQYEKGAAQAVYIAELTDCKVAILQDRSPSCGVGSVHNGNFDGGLVDGDGITARALINAGIKVMCASDPLVDEL